MCPEGQIKTDLGCLPKDPAGFSSTLYGWGLALIGGVALLSILWGAYLVLSSQGDPQRLNRGRSYIVYALIGLVFAVAGYALYQIVTKDVLKIPGFI